jgi:hypothetical protein
MKKGISIALVGLLLTAMLHLSVATHYCHGNFAGAKISLSGKLASCGMEGVEIEHSIPGIELKSHCCDDMLIICGTDSNYSPSFYFPPDFYQNILQVFYLPAGLSPVSSEVVKSLFTNFSPPGELMSTNVDLTDICVFRI